jgi:chemotaxis family two-component system sensor kinase Cph1
MANLPVEAECASEPIHIPGGIQPYGYLLSIDDVGCIVQTSVNANRLAGAGTVVGILLAQVLGETVAARITTALAAASDDGIATYLGTIDLASPDTSIGSAQAGSGRFAIVVHRYAGARIVELVPAAGGADAFASIYSLVRSFISDVQHASTVRELAELAAREIQRIAGFGRTLIYNFDEEGHGHVIAEAIDPGYASYLGQRFPASDIPAQARELYIKNRVRLIADANYVAAELQPPLHPLTGKPTDLTFASLRSVSPIHIEYMKNMGTLSRAVSGG